MKLTMRPDRIWPLSSFLAFLDIKTGASIVLLFALLNKVAGVYGLLAVLTGAGGSLPQLSMYIYSSAALFVFLWGLKAIRSEDAKRALYFAHLYAADHVLGTAWTVFFAVRWWVYTPHDGARQANSPAQDEIVEGYIGEHIHLPEAARAKAAEAIWRKEKGLAMTLLVAGWLIKFYFAAVLYSYAVHLRRGTYRSLPLSRSMPPPPPSSTKSGIPPSDFEALRPGDDGERVDAVDGDDNDGDDDDAKSAASSSHSHARGANRRG